MSSTPDPGGNSETLARKNHAQSNPIQISMKTVRDMTLMSLLLITSTFAQNPPASGDPYRPRGEAKSPDGSYEWIVKTDAPLGYELVRLPDKSPIVTVHSYFSEGDPENVRYAKAIGVFWNSTGSLVVLDELNRRRSGNIYFFSINNGKLKQLFVDRLIPIPASADEARLVVDPGWVSPTKIRTRLAMKNKDGGFESKFYLIDLTDPEMPVVEPTN
jgi:hypothetical protein